MSENEEDQSNEITDEEWFLPPLEGGDLDWFVEDEFEPKEEQAINYGFSSSLRGLLATGPPGAGKTLAGKLKDLMTATMPAVVIQALRSPMMVMFDEAEKLLTCPKPGRVAVWSQATGWNKFFNPNHDQHYKHNQIKRKLGGKILSSSKVLRNLNLAVR